MEPISAHNPTPRVLRPPTALASDLAAVLREGQVLAGEVLQTLDGGSLLIGVGRHRVPAQSHVELPVGERFVFEVVRGADGQIELRVLRSGSEESSLLRALREVVGGRLPAGQRLGAVLAELGSLGASLGADVGPSSTLAARLQSFALRLSSGLSSGEVADQIQRLVQGSGLGTEAGLLRTALQQGPQLREQIAEAVRNLLAQGLAKAVPGGPSAGQLDALLGQVTAQRAAQLAARPAGSGDLAGLRPAPGRSAPGGSGGSAPGAPSAQGESPPPDAAAARGGGEIAGLVTELAGELDVLVRRALALARSSAAVPAGGARAQASPGPPIDAAALLLDAVPGGDLRELLVRSLLGEPLAPPRGSPFPGGFAELGGDLKIELLRALTSLLDAGPQAASVREALTQALASLEADQLLHIARREGGEPLTFGLPLWDGVHWTTVHLELDRHARPGAGGEGQVGKLSLAVDFTQLGPVRADFALAPGRLAVRIRARPALAQRLRALAPELVERLEREGRRVALAVVGDSTLTVETEREPGADPALDIGYLHDHHLVDRNG